MGKIVRCISQFGDLTIMAVNSTDMVQRAHEIHATSKVASAALGRLLTAASMMGAVLKGKDSSVTLRMNGGGPVGSVIAVSDSEGNVRGYIGDASVELPLNAKGKLDVAGAIGTDGFVTVIKDLGMKEPYIGQTQLVSGEIAEDITAYLATSEQIPSVCALGVLVERDWSIRAAGGYIIQLLPGVYDDEIDRLEECIKKARAVTECLDKGMSLEEIIETTLTGFEIEVLDEYEVGYRCTCSRERTRGVLMSIGAEELRTIAEEDGQAEVNCQFCDNKYVFNKKELYEIISEIESK